MAQIVAKGSTTITAGTTYTTVTHGCGFTPHIDHILPTPRDDLAGRNCWISNITSLTFRVNMSSQDTSDHLISYMVLR